MARPDNLVSGTSVTVTIHPSHFEILKKLVISGDLGGARNVPESISHIVAELCTCGQVLPTSGVQNLILREAEKKRKKPRK